MTELSQQDRQFAALLMNRAGIAFDVGDVALVATALRQFEVEAAWIIRPNGAQFLKPNEATEALTSYERGLRRGLAMAADALLSGEARQPIAGVARPALRVVS